jgi:hypothetical protein
MVRIIWEYMARADKLKEFESAYANSGPWAQLFRKYGEFHGTLLLRDTENACRFITVDRWRNAGAQRAMRERFAKEYEDLDRSSDALSESERPIGVFEEP